ncbi:non-ribosomal peptide synthetase [Nodularia sp. UHCC 0506]|uniref:non-ribosomal peptide synthetase n=1 Tax=Nodularia sp. UHCC 0506 TaxID=3110243 RepID=UPI002B205755|nr:non-ribosomal peptide synthetase [Nodularia sp. UHCC 0506]MEA5516072.1 non-ribosomal peptide synthetase [Nodularia sp. UHCC 0506]
MTNEIEYIAHSVAPEELFSQKIYWLNQLKLEIPETNFITDYLRTVKSGEKNQHIEFELPQKSFEYLLNLTNNSYLSIYVVLLTVLNTLLYKYTGNNDIFVGSPLPKQQNVEKLGHEILPLRSYVENTLNFNEFILQTKQTVIEAYSHPNFPLEDILKLLNISPNQNRQPIFDIVILLENIHDSHIVNSCQNDLTFSFLVTGNVIKGKVEYKNLLFRQQNIQLIIDSYIAIFNQICHNPHQQISEISCISPIQQHQLLAEFNDNLQNFPVDKSLNHLFENQAKRTPTHTAVICGDDKLTYQQLNETANRLARLLCNCGVKTGEFIGIIKQRDVNFLIAILAILKVGAVYVPIDSTYPPDRIKYMVSNSQVKFVLTDSTCDLTACLSDCPQLQHLIFLDINPEKSTVQSIINAQVYHLLDFANLAPDNLEVNVQGIDPAYMIYTSGSTGLPKGAIIRHGGAINHIYAQFNALELTENLIFLQSAAASSDISVWQFLAPLMIGGKVVIVDTETVCNPQKLLECIQSQNITIIELVPVIITTLLNYIGNLSADARLLPHLKWMMVTGESVSVELVNRWLQLYPEIKVVNAYGPTEAADDITQLIIDHPLPENLSTVPIGKPLANLNLYILDSQMQLLPIGVPGEICVSGFGVGLGYWQNSTSTQSSFIPNPFIQYAKVLPGTNTDLIYKTGDLGRWLPDGNIEFLGRIDHQVKIRGFRIELGEIETLLIQHHSVNDCVVVTHQEESGNPQLVAYVVANHQSTPSISELRNFLKEKLPDYMLPSAFMMLEALPLAPSGKIDRKALPKPDHLRPELESAYVMPQTQIEKVIVDVWQKALNLEKVGIADNFFELGGHSLIMLQIYSQLRELLPKKLSLMEMFKYPTVSSLAKFLSQENNQELINEQDEVSKKIAAGKQRLKQRLKQKK